MDIVLVPGHSLDGSSCEQVTRKIEEAGHRPHPVTLPAIDAKEPDLAAVVSVIDGCSTQVLLVGDSARLPIAYAALGARPDKVVRAIFVGGFPTAVERLTDARGYGTPLTLVRTDRFGGDDAELTRFTEVEYLDRPGDLADIILGSVPVTAAMFVEAAEDWRVMLGASAAYFVTSSFSQGVALADKIAPLADTGNRRLDVDLRYEGVTVSLTHHFTYDIHRDIEVARQVSAAASELGLTPDPSKLQTLNVMFHPEAEKVRPFWRALGWAEKAEEDLTDPCRRGPNVQFYGLDEIKPGDPQFHIDVSVGHDVAEARVKAVLEAGGRMVNDTFAPFHWTLADAEGNLVDIAQGVGREEHWGWDFAPDPALQASQRST